MVYVECQYCIQNRFPGWRKIETNLLTFWIMMMHIHTLDSSHGTENLTS